MPTINKVGHTMKDDEDFFLPYDTTTRLHEMITDPPPATKQGLLHHALLYLTVTEENICVPPKVM